MLWLVLSLMRRAHPLCCAGRRLSCPPPFLPPLLAGTQSLSLPPSPTRPLSFSPFFGSGLEIEVILSKFPFRHTVLFPANRMQVNASGEADTLTKPLVTALTFEDTGHQSHLFL